MSGTNTNSFTSEHVAQFGKKTRLFLFLLEQTSGVFVICLGVSVMLSESNTGDSV
jgi:hypothetical protein